MLIMNGKELSEKRLTELGRRVEKLSIPPKLCVIQVGNDSASNIYLKHKEKMCKKLGILFEKINLPHEIHFENIQKEIEKLNQDESVDAILVQFPLPENIDEKKVSLLIDPKKDADGIHPFNQGIIVTETEMNVPQPCTPHGVMTLLNEYNINVPGKHVVVIGRSNIAGRPMSNLLINANATVSLIHTLTSEEDKRILLKNADVIVTATGYKDVFDNTYVKKDVVIVDIGIIKIDGKLRGDIDYKSFEGIASAITPVPGGVGPMTVSTLMENVIKIAENKK